MEIKGVDVKLHSLALLLFAIGSAQVLATELTLTYDGNGNLESGDGYCREYNGLNQLNKIYLGNECTGNPIEEYVWHPLEEKILIRDRYHPNGSLRETIYYVSDEYIKIVNESGEFDEVFVWQDGQLVGFINTDGQKRAVLANHLGSVQSVLDEQGNVIEESFYSPFGEIIEGGKLTRYDYTGQEYNEDLNEYDFNARRYRADLARFTQPDTVIQNAYDPQYLNHYAYARNNPYKYVDPDGRNARVYFNKDAAQIPVLGPQGHIAIGVDDANNPGQEVIFENSGLLPYQDRNFPDSLNTEESSTYRQFLSLFGVHHADTYEFDKELRDEDGRIILPEGYDDYFEIEQGVVFDQLMIDRGRTLNSKPWNYQAFWRNSQHYAGQILEAAGYDVQYGSNPKETFERNKNRKWVSSAYKSVGGVKRYKIWNKGRGRATGNAYCKKGCG